MKKTIYTIIVVAIVVGGALLVRKRMLQVKSLKPPLAKLVAVYMVPPQQREVEETRQFLGTYYSIDHPSISSKVSGVIKKVCVREGEWVNKGKLLVEIDQEEIIRSIKAQRSSIRSLKEAISGLEETVSALRSDYLYSRHIFERNQALYRAGAISRERLEESKVGMELKKARMDSTLKEISSKKQQLKALKEELLSKRHLLTYTQIRSPIDGVVGQILLRPGDMAMPGRPILTLYGKKKRVEFSYPLSFMGRIKKGQKVYILGRPFTITALEAGSSRSLARAYIDLDSNLPLPHMSNVTVEVVMRQARGWSVPVSALLERKDGTFVFVHTSSRFVPLKVKVLAIDDSYAVISPPPHGDVAIGSADKLSRLFVIKRTRGIRYE